MNELCLESVIYGLGSIATVRDYEYGKQSYERKDNSVEDYIGKITAVFLPYIYQNISDKSFMNIQKELERIVSEIRKIA